MKIDNKNFFVCATEQSGDNIGSLILELIKRDNPIINIDGVGGKKMNNFMNNQYYNLNHFDSMGIFEIIWLNCNANMKKITYSFQTTHDILTPANENSSNFLY